MGLFEVKQLTFFDKIKSVLEYHNPTVVYDKLSFNDFNKTYFYNDIYSWITFGKTLQSALGLKVNQVKKHSLCPFKNMYGWIKNSAFWF